MDFSRFGRAARAARTLRTVDGKTVAGREIVWGMMHRVLRGLTHERREEQRGDIRDSLIDAMQVHATPKSLLERFDAVETRWTPPSRTGFEQGADLDAVEADAERNA